MKNIVYLLLLMVIHCFVFTDKCFADESNENAFIDFIPKTPEAALLEQYGNMSVNNATGVPEINIPLHVIQIDGVKIPISISYQATGIRVNDVPTQVGVNWMLNAGGLVSRNILGLPDEQGNGGWFNFFNDNGEPDVTEETCDLHKLEGYYKVTHDASPDIYSYQFGGYSGGFFFYNEDSIVKIGGQELIMNVTFPFSANFTDRYGNNYFFNEHTSIDQTNVIRYGGNSETSTGFQITANRLDLIETYLGKTIEFDYEPKSDTIVTSVMSIMN